MNSNFHEAIIRYMRSIIHKTKKKSKYLCNAIQGFSKILRARGRHSKDLQS